MFFDKRGKMLTDEELIKKVQNGDAEAENELLSRYKDLVVKISRSFYIVGGDLEDIIQEGMIGLYNAIKNYHDDKEASFKTFAVICIKHKIQGAIKKSQSNKNKPLSSAVSIQSFDSEGEEFYPIEFVLDNTPAKIAIEKENLKDLKENIKSSLSKLEFKVLKLYLEGYSYREIAEILNIQQKAIDNSLSRIKQKLRAKLNKEDIA